MSAAFFAQLKELQALVAKQAEELKQLAERVAELETKRQRKNG